MSTANHIKCNAKNVAPETLKREIIHLASEIFRTFWEIGWGGGGAAC